MGEAFQGTGTAVDSHEMANAAAKVAVQDVNIQGIPTDVDGIFADQTKDNLPVFNVSKEEFYNNMKAERKRLRFKAETPAAKYLQGSRYNRPFYLAYQDDAEGGQYLRKVK